ncbi:outer membrane beta-barrel protein [Sphingomonas sp. DT-51]|uniref:outer membrane beta-barrel protein n=1 Tax=Sphingomonas sp. DT-51 TaxID=3396165 RepID=UPI003F1D30F5
MKSLLLIATAAALWLPNQADAQDAPFQGPRVQLDVAYDRIRANEVNPDLPHEFDAAYLGGTIGYDHIVTDGLLIGLEAGFGKPLGERQRVPLGSDALSVKLGREWLAGMRIAAPVTPSTLVFATAGYSNAASRVMYESPADAGGDHEVIEESEGGFAWGLGIEQVIRGKAYMSAAFRSAHYGDGRYQDDVDRTQVRLGAGLRF